MRRFLPLALLTTALVTALPAVLVAAIAPRGSPLLLTISGLAAVALSLGLSTAAAALWKRQPRSRDVVFSDLLLWGWLRRCWTERRLSQARDLYESARKSGPAVSIELLTGLSRLLEARDAYTHRHGQRVARHATRIARSMRLSPTQVAKIRTAATVHDVGKLYSPREILNNPGQLSPAEFGAIKRHAADGADMLAGVGDPEIVAMVRHHHERMDGGGYPDGLAGAAIPIGARIIAVADTFDAITSNRAYRRAGTQKKALDVLRGEAGERLDSAAVAAFRHRYSDRRSIAWLAVTTAVAQRGLAGLQAASHSFAAAAGGIASVLPALGVAGALTLSSDGSRHTHRVAVPARSQGAAVVTTALPHAPPVHLKRPAGAHAGTPVHRRNNVRARSSPTTLAPRHSTAVTPRPTSGERTTSGSGRSGAAAPAPQANPGLPLTPPATPPPAGEQPPGIPPPPVTPPPVTLPSVPSVPGVPSVPSVPSLPSIPGVRGVIAPALSVVSGAARDLALGAVSARVPLSSR
jgi:HD-GYP domain-containing protein (c-di-GMP phosphodiesterase class II)